MPEHKVDDLEELIKGKYEYAEDLYLWCLHHNVSADYILVLPKGMPYPECVYIGECKKTEGSWRGIRKQIARNLHKVRRAKGFTEIQVAEYLGLSHRVFYREYEVGYSSLLLSVLRQLCLCFDVSADCILGLPKGLPYPDGDLMATMPKYSLRLYSYSEFLSQDYILGLPQGLPYLEEEKQEAQAKTGYVQYCSRVKRLREARKIKDFTQSQVAEHLGIHRSDYTKAESDQYTLSISEYYRLCLLYEVSADYLLCRPEGLLYPDDNEQFISVDSWRQLAKGLQAVRREEAFRLYQGAECTDSYSEFYWAHKKDLYDSLPSNELYQLCLYYDVSADCLLGLPKGLPYPNDKLLVESGESEDKREKIANNLKAVRIEKGFTFDQIAEHLGITLWLCRAYERAGKLVLLSEELYQLCMLYNVSADYILGLPKGMPFIDDLAYGEPTEKENRRERIALNLKTMRTMKGVAARQIGKYLGVDWQRYMQYEHECYVPLSVDKLYQSCLHYDVSADYLLRLPKGLSYPDDAGQRAMQEAEDISNLVGNGLRTIRKAKRLTQCEAAERLSISRDNYVDIERGRCYLSASELYPLCLLYEVSADYLLGLPKGMPYPDDEK